jgi:hypothetical protein
LNTADDQVTATKSKLRWYQYSLRSLLLLVTVCALACSWLFTPTVRARRFVAAVKGGDCGKGRPPLYNLISEEQARRSEFSIEPLSWKQLWRGETEVTIDVPASPSGDDPGCVINCGVSRFEIRVNSCREKIGPGRPDWYVDYINQWDSLLQKAGQSSQGLVVETRFCNIKAGKAPSMLLSVRHLGVQPITISEGACDQNPIVLIRDARGRSARMTTPGERFHAPNVLWGGSVWTTTLWPGGACQGQLISLADNFVLSESGTYTLLAVKSGWGTKGDLISKPIQFTISQADASEGEAQSGAAVPDSRGLLNMRREDKEEEWSRLESKAGRPQYGRILEADISPIIPNAVHLIASLINLNGYDTQDITPFQAGTATEYRVVVRDPAGRMIAANEAARMASAIDMRLNNGGSFNVGQGNGNGVIIPLAKWFNMRLPGEYTVLVSLPTQQEGEPVWVAKPIKVKVDEHLDSELPTLVKDSWTQQREAMEAHVRALDAEQKPAGPTQSAPR